MARILYVEDDLSLNFVTQDQLEKRDYTVVSCVNGIQGLEVFKKEVFDLCVLDVMLPEMDGFELAKKYEKQTSIYLSFFLRQDLCKKTNLKA